MKRIVVVSVVAVVLALGALTAAIAVKDDGGGGWRHPMTTMMRGTPGTGWTASQMRSWMRESVPTSEDAYLVEMVAHHQDAVTAARELARSDRPQMRALGASIVATQTRQIEQMQAWLDEWYPDAGPADYQPMMRDLSGLSGDALDRAFLRDMIGHHMMAVMMSQHLLVSDLPVHPQVATLARDIRDAQRREIAVMARWSADWFGDRFGMGMMGSRWGAGRGSQWAGGGGMMR